MRNQLSIFLICTLILIGSLPTTFAEEPSMDISLWDRCETLTDTEMIWTKCPDNISDLVLSIDPSVQSPLNTGSIKMYHPGTPGVWELTVAEIFNEDASLLKDFTISRPRSVFVMGSRSIVWHIEVITRENQSDPLNWVAHTIALRSVPADAMMEILLDYSAIPNSLLKLVAQVNVVPHVDEQEFTGYVAGITKGDLGTLSIDTTPVQGEVFVNGISWGISPQSRRLNPGIYTVSFGDIVGYTKPTPEIITVVANQTGNFVAEYLKTFIITASSDGGGSISPSGSIPVAEGFEQVFTATPENGYHVLEVTVDGIAVGKIDTYTFSSIQGSHTIHVSFELTPSGIPYSYMMILVLSILAISFVSYLRIIQKRNNHRVFPKTLN